MSAPLSPRTRALAPFVVKLLEILEAGPSSVIRWSTAGTSFLVLDRKAFCRDVLATQFKSDNFASFVRQLNFYGFHKLNSSGKGLWEFTHPLFIRGRLDLMQQIKRRHVSEPNTTAPTSAPSAAHVNIKKEMISVDSPISDCSDASEVSALRQEVRSYKDEVSELRRELMAATSTIRQLQAVVQRMQVNMLQTVTANMEAQANTAMTTTPLRPTALPKKTALERKRRRAIVAPVDTVINGPEPDLAMSSVALDTVPNADEADWEMDLDVQMSDLDLQDLDADPFQCPSPLALPVADASTMPETSVETANAAAAVAYLIAQTTVQVQAATVAQAHAMSRAMSTSSLTAGSATPSASAPMESCVCVDCH